MSASGLPRSESRTERIARAMRNEIAAGVWRHGQALPSTRELARRWKVSDFTISSAMRILAKEGLIISRERSRRIVNAPDQAERREFKAVSPQVVVIGGYAGSGKTELGRMLVRETGWPLLDKDTLTRPVVETALEVLGQSPHDRESDVYQRRIRPREYEALLAAGLENVECGNSVILTAPFIRELADPSWIQRTVARFEDLGAQVTIVWVYCDPDTMHTYLRMRGAARDAAKLADWPSYLASIDVDFRPSVPHVVVDNSATATPLQQQARSLVAQLVSRQPSRSLP